MFIERPFSIGEFVIAINPVNDHPDNCPAIVTGELCERWTHDPPDGQAYSVYAYKVRLLIDGDPIVVADPNQLRRPRGRDLPASVLALFDESDATRKSRRHARSLTR